MTSKDPFVEKYHLLNPTFLPADIISPISFISNLYIQYHCLPRILTVKRLDSLCHSIKRNKKFEFIKIFIHQIVGIKHTSKSPHFP